MAFSSSFYRSHWRSITPECTIDVKRGQILEAKAKDKSLRTRTKTRTNSRGQGRGEIFEDEDEAEDNLLRPGQGRGQKNLR